MSALDGPRHRTSAAGAPAAAVERQPAKTTKATMPEPVLFNAAAWTTIILLVGGFLPAFIVFLRRGWWWLNPILQPPEWKAENTPTMQWHNMFSSTWVVICFLQFTVAVRFMPWKPFMRTTHKYLGYSGLLCLVGMAINANYMAYYHGVAGKVTTFAIAPFIASMMIYHAVPAMRAIRRKDRRNHIWHMCSLFIWTAFPGLLRSLGALPAQLLLVDPSCDVTYTSGFLIIPALISVGLLYLLRRGALGAPWRFADYNIWWLVMVLDVVLALADGSFLTCPSHPLLAQVPGKPFVLQGW